MTIEVVYEVDCDACGWADQHDAFTTKAALWEWLREGGWKRRGPYLWCPTCVKAGHYKANYIAWKDNDRYLPTHSEG